VDRREISIEPGRTAARIAALLNLGGEAMHQMTKIFENNRPQQTESGSSERLLTLTTTGWTEQQLQVFHSHCDEEMTGYGYSLNEEYWIEGHEVS
jgi:hypothetical protein